MANATNSATGGGISPDDLPLAPTAEEWRAMAPDERLRFEVEANEALTAVAALMPEGRRHKQTKSTAIDALSLHFKRIGRTIYLAEDLAVHYPGEKPFSPDILAVLDVAQPEDDDRMAWEVAVECKGPNFVLEVLHHGDRKKDLVGNVERYARLGIQEYFVYDRLRQQIRNWHLPIPGASTYEGRLPQRGHHRSDVLGIDLAIIGDNLRFLVGEATLPVSTELIDRLWGIQANLEAKAEQAEAKAEQALAKGLQEGLLTILDARGIPCPDEARAHIESCADPAMLRRWMLRAKTAGSVEDVFAAA